MRAELSSARVLVTHEWLYTWAGAERVLEDLLAVVPQADLLVGIVTPDMRARNAIAARARETWVGAVPGARRHHRWFLPLHALAFGGFDTSGYDLIISVSHAFEKMVRPRNGAVHVCYCLSPPRHLWDLQEQHERLATGPQRLALRASAGVLRALDLRGASGVDRFISISHHIAERVRRCYGRDSAVVYPPVKRANGAAATATDAPYLLTVGRLVPYKRVDLAVQAADLLGMRLVVVGDGPERARLEAMGSPHVEFRGRIRDDEVASLLAGCAAFLFCAEEDFGIAPLEANAHGRPVVAYRAGAATETLVDGESGVLFDRQEADAVADAVRRALAKRWDASRLRRNADRFAPERFRDAMQRELASALARA